MEKHPVLSRAEILSDRLLPEFKKDYIVFGSAQ